MTISANSQAKVLLICPVRNEIDRIDTLMHSLRAQSFTDWNLVFFDNASIDGTLEKLEKYSSEDPRIRVEPSPVPLPIHQNFRRAFEFSAISNEPYLQFVAADDFLGEQYLDSAIRKISSTSSDFILGKIQHFSKDQTLEENDFKNLCELQSNVERASFALRNYWICNALYGFYHRKFFLKVIAIPEGAFTDNLSSDWWFSLGAIRAGSFSYSEKVIYFKYRKPIAYQSEHYTLKISGRNTFTALRSSLLFPFQNVGDRVRILGPRKAFVYFLHFLVRDLRTAIQSRSRE